MICFSANVFATDWRQLPDGICAKYAAQEFEKNAPPPGVNWLNKNSDWVLQANNAGWVTRAAARDAMVGAIAEWETTDRNGGGHVAIVRAVLSDRIIVEENNVGKVVDSLTFSFGGIKYKGEVTDGWGKTTIRAIKYDDLMKVGNRFFAGYIWPVRQDEYEKDPTKYQISYVDEMQIKEPRYKGFLEYWGPAYMLKEFDKIAPNPGVNWRGNVTNWMGNAQTNGWITKIDSHDAKIGALVIRINPTSNQVKVGIVRDIKTDEIVVDSRKSNLYPYTEIIQLDDLKLDKDGFKFVGYIWPVRG
jgi:surface antigen